MIRQYLSHWIDQPAIWDWLASSQWDLDDDDRRLAEEIEDALIYFNDGYLDESDVRLWLSNLREQHTIKTGYFITSHTTVGRFGSQAMYESGTAAITSGRIEVLVADTT